MLEDHARDHAHQGWVGQAASDPRRSGCPRCADGGRCRSCAQRRKHAWRLVEQRGLSYERAAARMRLTPGQVRLLVFRERDHQELKRFKLDLIPTERVRAFDRARARARPVAVAGGAGGLDGHAPDRARPPAGVCAGQGRAPAAADRDRAGEQDRDRARARAGRPRRLLSDPEPVAGPPARDPVRGATWARAVRGRDVRRDTRSTGARERFVARQGATRALARYLADEEAVCGHPFDSARR